MATAPFSVRLAPKLRARLEKEAKSRNRTAGFMASLAIQRYFEEVDRFNAELDAAVAEADKGIFISGDAMQAWMNSWGTENELPPPEPDVFLTPKVKTKKVA